MRQRRREEALIIASLEDLSEDPSIQQFCRAELEHVLRSIDLKVLIERLATRHDLTKESVRRAVFLALKKYLSEID